MSRKRAQSQISMESANLVNKETTHLQMEKKNGEVDETSFQTKRRFSIEPTNTDILVVDDDTLTLRIAEKLLHRVGYSSIINNFFLLIIRCNYGRKWPKSLERITIASF
jgi:hypothetical protein